METVKLKTYYYLARPDAKDKTNIMCLLGYKSNRIRLSTRLSVEPSNWDVSKKWPKKDKELRNDLEAFEEIVKTVELEFTLSNEVVTVELARDRIIEKLTGVEIVQDNNKFTTYIQKYYDQNKDVFAANTIVKYKTLKNFIEIYSPDVTLEELSPMWALNLKAYCLNNRMLNNTISKRFQFIRVVLKWCISTGIIKSFDFTEFTHPRDEKSDRIYLNYKQLSQLRKLDLSKRPALMPIRDLFIIASFTGIDWGDLPQIKKDCVRISPKGKKYLSIVRRKTKKKEIVSSPQLIPEVEEILNKYKWKLSFISYDKSLEHLKEICKLAGFAEPITLTTHSGGNEIKETRPLYDWVSWKSGRRSYITNLFQDNNSAVAIAKAVGHLKISTTEIYNQGKEGEFVDMVDIKIGGSK